MGTYLRSGALVVAVLGLAALFGASLPRADYQTERRIALHNIHNGEDISIVYKRDGEYVADALEKLNWFMRDWRVNKPTKMDPHTIDIVWEIHEELGSKVPINFVSGYRSPGTNEALRRAGGGQAKHSQHILGKAMDVSFPDVPVQKLRYAGLVREQGGVGYYPTSGVPFVHIDTGNVRMWPRMPRYELALLFPKGHSKFVPLDGKPISATDVGFARTHYTQMAEAIAAFHQFRASAKDRTLVASLEPTPPKGQIAVMPDPVSRPLVTAAADAPAADEVAQEPDLQGPALQPAATAARVIAKRPKPVVASLTLASLREILPPKPQPARRQLPALNAKALSAAATVAARPAEAVTASLESMQPPEPVEVTGNAAFLNKDGWVSAPDFDEDHDSELSYRPFPLGNLIEANPSIDNPMLAKFVRPDLGAAHDSIGSDEGQRMQFKPDLKVAEMIWSDEYNGRDATPAELVGRGISPVAKGHLVKTASRS